MKIETLTITPSLAKELLVRNIGNRQKKENRITQYAKDMLDGKWMCETFEPIKISSSGDLLDGQNRLYAIIKANVPVKLQVATGLNKDIFKVIDSGCSRNASDIFKIDGIKNSSMLPSVITIHDKLNRGLTGDNFQRISSQTIMDMYYNREEFYKHVATKTHSWYVYFNQVLQQSIIGGIYAHFYDINPIMAEQFFNQMCSGNDIKHNAINLLRNKLFADKISIKKMSPSYKNALIIKTWNYFRKNQQVKILKFDAENESFPKAI